MESVLDTFVAARARSLVARQAKLSPYINHQAQLARRAKAEFSLDTPSSVEAVRTSLLELISLSPDVFFVQVEVPQHCEFRGLLK